ncbi:site-specific DNA-methyltransferase [Segetibacter sp. 3557_3]|uniref:site-specific DNA-methyltransferase n=1 Tax=Segetibacter sp. 3557_3 TaxID=2547429 RepID=UPI001058EDA5|nr:site-specific DNA-methyltransferase [Segetibacter sp. 3557_3]TDH23965.1 site-specific DNA-methyltransferase [Segetibacter sp. 3557_3]
MSKQPQKLELTWIGKDMDPKLEPRILIEEPTKSYGDPKAENLLINGDNLLALKALEQEFTGKIKCIYIDPPFNTGAAFEHYDDGIEHSVWLDLMARRLKILQRLLASDGVIFVHIDDKEMAYLRMVMDEIFQRNNFLNMMVVKTSDPSGHKVVNPSPYSQTEYILMYAKNRRNYKYDIQYVSANYDVMYNKIVTNIDENYADWKIEGLAEHYAKLQGFNDVRSAKRAKGKLDFEAEVGLFAEQNVHRVFQSTAISDAAGRTIVELREQSKINPQTVFYLEREDYDDIYIYGGRQMYFLSSKIKIVDNQKVIAKPLTNLWTDIPYNGIAGEGGVIFKNGKKPEKLVKRCIEMSTEEGDWILDSFLGSGTTAAVAHKMKRKWIGIELGEHANTHCTFRLKQIVDGIDESGVTKTVNWKGGGGFKFYTLAPSLLKQDQYGNWVIDSQYNADMLAAAMAKQEGFHYSPDESIYWKQGKSSEKDFIFTTTQFMTVEVLDRLHEGLKPDESLLICCKSFKKECKNKHSNITIKKIPQMLLGRCEFGKDDYSLTIVNAPEETEANGESVQSVVTVEHITIKSKKQKSKSDNQPSLF